MLELHPWKDMLSINVPLISHASFLKTPNKYTIPCIDENSQVPMIERSTKKVWVHLKGEGRLSQKGY